MNNGYTTLLLNLFDLTNFNTVDRKLKPDFSFLKFFPLQFSEINKKMAPNDHLLLSFIASCLQLHVVIAWMRANQQK
jgi:hypothetical protein